MKTRLAILLLIVAACLSALAGDSPVLRAPAAAVLLLAPGWGLSRWWPSSRDDLVSWCAAAIGTALACDVLVACALGLPPFGLDRTAVAISFAAVGLLATVTAPRAIDIPGAGLSAPGPVRIAAYALPAVAAIAVIAAAVHVASDSQQTSEARLDITALSVTPDGAVANVVLEADRPGTYELVVSRDGAVLSRRTSQLEPEDTISMSVASPPPGSTISAEAFREPGDGAPLRTVTLVGAPRK